MVNVWLELPPPGPGFTTVTGAVPAFTNSVAGTVATIEIVVCDVTVRAVPAKVTEDDERKLLPVIASERSGDPALALDGDSDVIAGTGFTGGGGASEETVNGNAFDVAPPGFVTVTGNVPAVTKVNEAAIWVLFATDASTVLEPNVTLAPGRKLLPVSVTPIVDPVVPDAGEILLNVGAGFVSVRLTVPEVPPPGAGLTT
jgi:hypothetical protein